MNARRAVPILVLVGLATCWAFEGRGRVPFSSDQAVVAIQAQDILERGVHPVFYYGAEYAGTLEPHYLAVAFAIFGATPLVFRGAMALLVLLAVLGAWATAREAFGERAGFFAGLYLALGPSFFLYKGLTSDGAYSSLLALSSLSLWLMLVVERRTRESRPTTAPLVGLGLAMGLAWWVHTPSVFLGAVLLAAALSGTRRLWLSVRTLALLAASFIAGSLPWWVRNFETGMRSLRSHEMAGAEGGRFAAQVQALFVDGWSILLGARSVWSLAPTFLGARWVALGLLVALVGFGLRSTGRGVSGPAIDARSSQKRYGATLCLTAMISLSVLCLMVSRTDFGEPRYLFAAYAGVAPLVGGLVDAVWTRRLLRVALLASLVALNVGSEVLAPVLRHSDPRGPSPHEQDPGPVLDQLRAQGVRSLYTSYWMAYKLTFLARGDLVASPLGRGANGVVRIPEMKTVVDRDPDPGFLLQGEDRAAMAAYLSAHVLTPRRVGISGFVLYRGLPEDTLRVLKGCNCIPTTLRPGEVAVLSAEGAPRLEEGEVAPFRVAVRNDSARPLSDNVHLSYHWIRRDGRVADWDGERADTGGWPVGTTAVSLPVRASVPPGEYLLVFDLVDEKVSWLGDLGGRTLTREVVVGARAR